MRRLLGLGLQGMRPGGLACESIFQHEAKVISFQGSWRPRGQPDGIWVEGRPRLSACSVSQLQRHQCGAAPFLQACVLDWGLLRVPLDLSPWSQGAQEK